MKLIVTLVVLGILAIPALVLYANHQLQQSRIQSCEKTYRAFPEMFEPFRKTIPKRDFKKIEDRAEELAATCVKQIRT